MKLSLFFSLLLSCVLSEPAMAQWKTETYQLKGGWNAIFLHGDASYSSIDDLLASGVGSNILEIWRWNQGTSPVLYTQDPAVQTPGSPEWSIWKRNDSTNNTLSKLTANVGYLVRCAGTNTDSYSVPITLSPRPPRTQWVRQGANLLSFQTKRTSPTTHSNYFSQGFPAPVASGSGIYKYIGGPLSGSNPFKIFSPSFEPLNRNQAYWYEAKVVDNYHGPIAVELSNVDGLMFMSQAHQIRLKLTNRTNQVQNLTLTQAASSSPPIGQKEIAGTVPIAVRSFDPQQLNYTSTPLSDSSQLVLQPNSSLELNLVIDSSSPNLQSTAPGSFLASLLTITDASGLIEYELPVSFTQGSLAGLWLGEALITHIPYTPKAQAQVVGGSLASINIVGRAPEGYVSAPLISVSPPSVQGIQATATAEITNGVISSFTLTNPGSGYEKPPGIRIVPPPAANSTPLPKAMSLRVLMHRDDSGTYKLLSRVYMGSLLSTGELGLCTSESFLDPEKLASASRFSVAHLPIDVINRGTGGEAGSLTHTVFIPHNDATNPFVHQYHPDHDNLDARFENQLPAGDESPNITRTLQFEFTTTDPTGEATPLGWGSTVLGGNFTETLEGIHSDPITLQGNFRLQRISDIPTLVQ